MDIHKLKLNSDSIINLQNFPSSINLEIESVNRKLNTAIYYVGIIEDLYRAIKHFDSLRLPDDNRVILVFNKVKVLGVNQNTIMAPFKAGKFPNYKLKAPMMCSLSEDLMACVFRRVNPDAIVEEEDSEE